MKKRNSPKCSTPDVDRILSDIQSSDDHVRAKAVGALCPCRAGWLVFEQNIGTLSQLRNDPSAEVRKSALHVFQDAGEMENCGYPTNPREATDEMLRKKRASRFRADMDDTSAKIRSREKRGRVAR